MKSYPSIDTKLLHNERCFLFDKLDGSNIRAEWNRKQGFYKFGSRTQLLGEDHPILGGSINLFREKYSEPLSKKFTDKKYESAVCYVEYYGEQSFAGSHNPNEEHTVTLFDIDVYKKGLLPPDQYLELTEDLDTAQLLHTGQVTGEIFNSIKAGTFEGMTFEGVVAKTVVKNQIKMFKIKSYKWLDRLALYCNGNQRLYEMLK